MAKPRRKARPWRPRSGLPFSEESWRHSSRRTRLTETLFIYRRRNEVPPVIAEILERIRDQKVPESDSVLYPAIKLAIRAKMDLFAAIYSAYLHESKFTVTWKQQRLVSLPKGNKQPSNPQSYRPIWVLDAIGKVPERIICSRMAAFSEGSRGLSTDQ